MAVIETTPGVDCITHVDTIIVMEVAMVDPIVISVFAGAIKDHLLGMGHVGTHGVIL